MRFLRGYAANVDFLHGYIFCNVNNLVVTLNLIFFVDHEIVSLQHVDFEIIWKV